MEGNTHKKFEEDVDSFKMEVELYPLDATRIEIECSCWQGVHRYGVGTTNQ